MSVPSPLPRKGLNSIRTMSDMISETSNPQRKYLKLAMLSLERARRAKESESARSRVRDIEVRMAEIDVERANLFKSAQEDLHQEEIAPEPREKEARHPIRSGFKVRY